MVCVRVGGVDGRKVGGMSECGCDWGGQGFVRGGKLIPFLLLGARYGEMARWGEGEEMLEH
jgi:hypothetical protein